MQQANYVRLFASPDGESHFEDLSIELAPVDFAPPAPPLNIAAFGPAVRTLWVGADAAWAGDVPHPSPRRQVFCTVKGGYEVTASDGDVRSFPVGSVLLLEDTHGRGHATRVSEDALIFAVVVDPP